MVDGIFAGMEALEDIIWSYLGFPLIALLGIYFTLKSGFFQLRAFPDIIRLFISLARQPHNASQGVHPLKAFFAALGGCIGIGNIVAVCTAVQIGGPGAVLWLWLTALVGMLVKYSEVYLGVKYRERNSLGSYDGGPMFYLRQAKAGGWAIKTICFLLCVYGVEVFMFRIITESITYNIQINYYAVVGVLLCLTLTAGLGGIQRVGNICSAIIPAFLFIFSGMSLWIFLHHLSDIPAAFQLIVSSAFTGHAAVGGFAGSTLLMTISQGVRRACYTGDIGIGYASVIHSEANGTTPNRQASLAILEIFLDTFVICTMSLVLILVTGVWSEPIDSSMMIQTVLEMYFPGMWFFMPLFIFLLGYSTMIAFFAVGIKSAQHLSPRYGKLIYTFCAAGAFILFSFVDTYRAQTLMSLSGGLLLLFNLYGFYILRRKITFELNETHSCKDPICEI